MLTRENTGLIVIDIQGKLARIVEESDTLISNVSKLIQGTKTLDLPIIWLEQNPDRLGKTVAELAGQLTDHQPISKLTFSACKEPEFLATVEHSKVKNWLICGIEAHICVYQTALELNNLDYDVEIVVDCVSSRTIANKEVAMTKLMSKGVGITSLEMCLYELVQICTAKEFKEILKLIK